MTAAVGGSGHRIAYQLITVKRRTVAKILEAFGIALANDLRAAVTVENMNQLPRVAVNKVGIVHNVVIIIGQAADLIAIGNQFIIIAQGRIFIHHRLGVGNGLGNDGACINFRRTGIIIGRLITNAYAHDRYNAGNLARISGRRAETIACRLIEPIKLIGAIAKQGIYYLLMVKLCKKVVDGVIGKGFRHAFPIRKLIRFAIKRSISLNAVCNHFDIGFHPIVHIFILFGQSFTGRNAPKQKSIFGIKGFLYVTRKKLVVIGKFCFGNDRYELKILAFGKGTKGNQRRQHKRGNQQC